MVESKGWKWEIVEDDENSIWKNHVLNPIICLTAGARKIRLIFLIWVVA